jgi:hypothetical protein
MPDATYRKMLGRMILLTDGVGVDANIIAQGVVGIASADSKFNRPEPKDEGGGGAANLRPLAVVIAALVASVFALLN